MLFPGQVNQADLPRYYRMADLYVSASHSDGSSISLLEAMACGRASLVSDIPGNREWVDPGDNGWWFRDGDADSLAQGILQAIEQRERLPAMGRSARRIAEQRADWEKNFPHLLDGYRLALSQTRVLNLYVSKGERFPRSGHPRAIAIIQARRASSRLPDKVLLDICGEPMLVRVIERAKRAKTVDAVVVATTTDPSDDAIQALCEARGYPLYRGSSLDVLDRYYQAARPIPGGYRGAHYRGLSTDRSRSDRRCREHIYGWHGRGLPTYHPRFAVSL